MLKITCTLFAIESICAATTTTDNSLIAASKPVTRDILSSGRLFGVVFIFLWFLIGGIAHFVATNAEMRIVPPIVPWPRAAVLISGAFELLGAAGLLWWKTRSVAGWGLFALTIAVTPTHFYMLQRPELFDIPYWALLLRLPVQVALLALIAWSIKTPATAVSGESR